MTAVLCAALLLPAACAGGSSGSDRSDDGRSVGLVVLAASSLSDAFADIASAFEAENPGVEVSLELAGSSTLARQLQEGAPGDVFASADPANVDRVLDSGDARGPSVVFARNRLTIAVAPGNPEAVTGLGDLTRPDLRVVLCAEEVPCGRYAREAFARADVPVPPASAESDVRAALTKVAFGEADAALVYATDVVGREDVAGVDVAPEHQVEAAYPAVVSSRSTAPDAAAGFVEFLTGATAARLLADRGFEVP